MISIQNHQKLCVSDNQFDFGTSPSMGSTDWVRKYNLWNKQFMFSFQNHKKIGESDHQFDFGRSPSMRSTDWVSKYLQETWSNYKITSKVCKVKSWWFLLTIIQLRLPAYVSNLFKPCLKTLSSWLFYRHCL